MSSALLHPSAEEFNELLKNEDILLVDFFADWCGPCKMLAPVIDQIAEQYADKISVAKINIDENRDIASEYGIMSIPTIVVFKGGAEAAREVGVKPLEAFTNIIDGLM